MEFRPHVRCKMIWLLLGGWGKLGTDPLIPPSSFVSHSVGECVYLYVCVHIIGEVCKVSLTQSCKTDAHSQYSNLNISNSQFQCIYFNSELQNSAAWLQIILDFILDFVLLLVCVCCWERESRDAFFDSRLLWPVASLIQSTAHYAAVVCVCKRTCTYCASVCVYVHAVWTFQLALPPQASCRCLLTLAEYHILATQRSMENAAFPQYSVAQCACCVFEWGKNEEDENRWKKNTSSVWEILYVVWYNCVIYSIRCIAPLQR